MSDPIQRTLWRSVLKATTGVSGNPTVLVAALILTGLVASIIISRETTGDLASWPADSWRAPAGVFRAPHPALLPRAMAWLDL